MVDLRRIDAPELQDLAHLSDLLDAGERKRLARFARPADRHRYLAAHAGLRLLLGDRLGMAPRAVRLGRDACPICGDEHGRPISLDDPEGTFFSIAHTDGLVLLAIADATVGVDAETVGGDDLREDLDMVLHPDERAALERLPEASRARALLSCWVRTEAHLKALGTGLGRDPATVAVGPEAPGTVTRVDGWSVVDLDVGVGHVAAIALAGPGSGSDDIDRALVVEPLRLPV